MDVNDIDHFPLFFSLPPLDCSVKDSAHLQGHFELAINVECELHLSPAPSKINTNGLFVISFTLLHRRRRNQIGIRNSEVASLFGCFYCIVCCKLLLPGQHSWLDPAIAYIFAKIVCNFRKFYVLSINCTTAPAEHIIHSHSTYTSVQ